MKKIYNEQFNEVFFEDYCDNGLHIVVWHKPDFATTSCLFATPYGSLDIQQQFTDGQIKKHPAGIAHFLEHKLFESSEGDIMTKFASLGASVNAFTSFQETVYYFNTTSDDVDKSLNLLLDFVQKLEISDESVEKEKGIINQELSMYLEMPDSRFFFETLKSLYHTHPLRIDIGGDESSVNATTKKDLEECHQNNYHPKNMHIIICTPHDPQTIINLIKENQSKKEFPEFQPVVRFLDKEPTTVFQKEKVISMNVQQPKTCLGIKCLPSTDSILDQVKKEWCARFVLDAYFSSINPDYQTWIENQEISYYFGYEEYLSEDSSFLAFYDEGIDPEKFTSFMFKHFDVLKKISISEEVLEQLKNRAYGETLNTFNNPSKITIQYFRSLRKEISTFDLLNLIQSITVSDCNNYIQNLDFSNYCRVIIKPL